MTYGEINGEQRHYVNLNLATDSTVKATCWSNDIQKLFVTKIIDDVQTVEEHSYNDECPAQLLTPIQE